ncbi:MAG: hypothetical protein IOD15_09175 [Phycisphaerales bacterium]|nr:hypothetical protein [Phycisphaerales bacterium]
MRVDTDTQGATDGHRGDGGSVGVGGCGAGVDHRGGVCAGAGEQRTQWDGVRFLEPGETLDAFTEATIRREVEAAFADPVAARTARMMAVGLTLEWVTARARRLEWVQLALGGVGLAMVALGWVQDEWRLLPGGVGLAGVSLGLGWAARSLCQVVRRHDELVEFLYSNLRGLPAEPLAAAVESQWPVWSGGPKGDRDRPLTDELRARRPGPTPPPPPPASPARGTEDAR